MGAARYIKLSEAEDKQLRGFENSQMLNEKVRLRAKVLRLSYRGISVEEIASYTGRHATTVLRDFNRWKESSVQGLADGVSSGQRSPLGEEQKSFLKDKLTEERSWTASQLAEVVNKKFKLKVNRETMRVCLHALGYSWQRHRYVPVKQPGAELLAAKQVAFGGLKKEPFRATSS